VTTERNHDYGDPSDTLTEMAALFDAFTGTKIEPYEVAIFNILQKVVRLRRTRGTHADSWVDIAGYAAIGGEVAIPKERNNG